jgi:hypothetical protein
MKFPVKNIQIITALLALAAVYVGCTKGPDIKSYAYPAPEPKAVFPDTGYAGFADVTITGEQFGDYKQAVKVFFGGIQADTILSCEDGKIVARVPATAVSGKVSLQVWTHTIDSVGAFKVVPPPVVTTANKDIGLPGEIVEIAGKGFGSVIENVKVNFNGTTGTIAEISDTLLKVELPVGFTSGSIVVLVNKYPVTGPLFRAVANVPDPIYWLEFENNITDRISGVGATYNKGSAADLTYETGKSGLAVRFPGFTPATWNNSGTISIIPATIIKQKDFTVTCWVNWAAGRNIYPDPIFEFGEVRGSRICFLTRMGSGTNNWNGTQQKMVSRYLLQAKVPVGAPANYEDYVGALNAPVLPSATWKHVAFVFSYTNLYMKIYIDGVEAGTKNLSRNDVDPFLMTFNKASIGGYAFGSGTETAFAGLMDEFKLFNTALDADQIFAIYYKNR